MTQARRVTAKEFAKFFYQRPRRIEAVLRRGIRAGPPLRN